MAEKALAMTRHPDDKASDCDGAFCLHCRRGDPVRVVFLTFSEQGPREGRKRR
jgi:LmbE family N-acetylglucosaminyl deacetylase